MKIRMKIKITRRHIRHYNRPYQKAKIFRVHKFNTVNLIVVLITYNNIQSRYEKIFSSKFF